MSNKSIINFHYSFLPEDTENSISFFTQLLSQYRLIQNKKQNTQTKPSPEFLVEDQGEKKP